MKYNFLFNTEDNSYNYHSHEPIPEFMKAGTFEKQIDIDITQFEDITLVAWDADTNEIIDLSQYIIRLKGKDMQQKLTKYLNDVLPNISKVDFPDEYAKLMQLSETYLTPEMHAEIFADEILDDSEVQTILDELNN